MKPTLGIKPEIIWKQDRFLDIGEAISKRIEAGQVFPIEWAKEYIKLDEEIHQLGRGK